jgi:hypothetical protein
MTNTVSATPSPAQTQPIGYDNDLRTNPQLRGTGRDTYLPIIEPRTPARDPQITLGDKPKVIPGNGKGADISIVGDKNGQEIKVGDRTVSVSKDGIVVDLEGGKKMAIKRTEDGRIAVVTFDAQQKVVGFKLGDGNSAIEIPTGNGKFASLNVDVKNGQLLSFSIDTGGAAIRGERKAAADPFTYLSGKGPQVQDQVTKPVTEIYVDGDKLTLKTAYNRATEQLDQSLKSLNAVLGWANSSFAATIGGGNGFLTNNWMTSLFAANSGLPIASIREGTVKAY